MKLDEELHEKAWVSFKIKIWNEAIEEAAKEAEGVSKHLANKIRSLKK